MPTKEEILSALFPRTVDATYAGSGLARRSLAGTLDAASLPGRAYSALWHRYDEPMLQNMARTTATPGSALAAGVAEGMARDPLTLLSAPVGGLAGSGGRALASGVGSALLRRAAPVAADAAANAGLSALTQYGTEGRVNLADLAMGAGVGAGMQGTGAAMAKMAPAARAKIMGNPNFRKWFGDSKVVDEAGNPLTVYHGTASDFSEFMRPKATDKEGRRIGMGWGKGKFYFADNPDAANVSADWAARSKDRPGNNPSVMPVHLEIKNPISADDYMAQVRERIASGMDRDAAIAITDFQLKRQNIDGIVDPISGGHAVFSPTQIKSATGNRGTFDPNDPNITHFAGGQSPIAGANALAGRYFRGLMNRDEKKEKR